MSWRAVGDHPNSRQALQYRHTQLTKAASTFKGGRISVVKRFARDQKVLDMGCVSHNFAFNSGGGGRWLHQHVVQARGPFDVVVAGEIIEHLPAPQQLFASARELLRPGGKLVITTPNPYSPRRVRAGALGITWENADHILYAFPSGVAEMADRTGMVLKKFGTVGWPGDVTGGRRVVETTTELVRAARARAAGERAVPRRGRLNLPLPAHWLAPMDIALHAARGRRRMLGETSIYVLQRPTES